jgi:hypothetical protein
MCFGTEDKKSLEEVSESETFLVRFVLTDAVDSRREDTSSEATREFVEEADPRDDAEASFGGTAGGDVWGGSGF